MLQKNDSLFHEKEYGQSLSPRTIYNMVNLEIDYTLMELHEAMMDEQSTSIDLHKNKLKKLLQKRKQVEHYFCQSVDT